MKLTLFLLPAIAMAAVLNSEGPALEPRSSKTKLKFKVFADDHCTHRSETMLGKARLRPGRCRTFPDYVNSFIFSMPARDTVHDPTWITGTYKECTLQLFRGSNCKGAPFSTFGDKVKNSCVGVHGVKSMMPKCIKWTRDGPVEVDSRGLFGGDDNDNNEENFDDIDFILEQRDARPQKDSDEDDDDYFFLDERAADLEERCDDCGGKGQDKESANEKRCDDCGGKGKGQNEGSGDEKRCVGFPPAKGNDQNEKPVNNEKRCDNCGGKGKGQNEESADQKRCVGFPPVKADEQSEKPADEKRCDNCGGKDKENKLAS